MSIFVRCRSVQRTALYHSGPTNKLSAKVASSKRLRNKAFLQQSVVPQPTDSASSLVNLPRGIISFVELCSRKKKHQFAFSVAPPLCIIPRKQCLPTRKT